MARIYGARQRLSGRYDYAVWSDEESWPPQPEGYCAGPWDEILRRHEEGLTMMGIIDPAMREAWRKPQGDQFRFHSDGHATPEEAEACYRRYSFDCRREFDTPEQQEPCAICAEWTTNMIDFPQGLWFAMRACVDCVKKTDELFAAYEQLRK